MERCILNILYLAGSKDRNFNSSNLVKPKNVNSVIRQYQTTLKAGKSNSASNSQNHVGEQQPCLCKYRSNKSSISFSPGSGPNRGHYITIVKSHGFWLLFDDDIVEVGVLLQSENTAVQAASHSSFVKGLFLCLGLALAPVKQFL